MIRYTKQFYKNSCGPTALINAAKWAGYKVPGREFFKYYSSRCHFSFRDGTTYLGLSDALRSSAELTYMGFKANPTLSWLDKHLDRGHALIISYSLAKEDHGHMIFCPKRTKCFYYVVNNSHGKTVERISRAKMKQQIKEKRNADMLIYSGAWAVKPK